MRGDDFMNFGHFLGFCFNVCLFGKSFSIWFDSSGSNDDTNELMMIYFTADIETLNDFCL